MLLFGWSPHVKGVDIAIDAVAGLACQDESVVLGIVGTDDLRRYVAKRMPEGLPSWLRLLAPTDQVADLLHAASVFLSASRNEGLPYSVCEAMAAGTAVALSDIPALAWAHKAPGAVFFPPGDPAGVHLFGSRASGSWLSRRHAPRFRTRALYDRPPTDGPRRASPDAKGHGERSIIGPLFAR